jgi:hypothetical protein
MRPALLSPAQAAALRRARELAAELTELTASIRAALREEATAAPLPEPARFEPPVPEPALAPEPLPPEPAEEEAAPGLAAGELRAAFAAAKPGAGPRRRPRELFGH